MLVFQVKQNSQQCPGFLHRVAIDVYRFVSLCCMFFHDHAALIDIIDSCLCLLIPDDETFRLQH